LDNNAKLKLPSAFYPGNLIREMGVDVMAKVRWAFGCSCRITDEGNPPRVQPVASGSTGIAPFPIA
jgi:hypothetical protein